MKRVDVAYYLTHIWFEPTEQPEFEARLLQCAERIKHNAANGLCQILVFVDEATIPQEIKDCDELLLSINTVSAFFAMIKSIVRFPTIQLTGWTSLQDPLKYRQDIVNELFHKYRAIVEKVQQRLREKHENIATILEELNQLSDTEIWQFFLRHRQHKENDQQILDGIATAIPKNIWRRKRVHDLFTGIPGLHIIHGHMNNDDINNYNQWKKDPFSIRQINHPVQQQIFNDRSLLDKQRIEWYFSTHDQDIEHLGLTMDENTLFLLWGEYYNRCVINSGGFLAGHTYRKKVKQDIALSLIHPGDRLISSDDS